MQKLLFRVADSWLMNLILTLAIYALYAAVLGVCLFPSALLLARSLPLLEPAAAGSIDPARVFLFALSCGGSYFLFLIAASVVLGAAMRLLSLGFKPGRHHIVSLLGLAWLVYSGISTMAQRLVLPMIPVSFFSQLYFRLQGCRMGKNVRINTWKVSDAYLLTLGDNVVIGGEADVSCHSFENNYLVLGPITVGENSLIGARCYVSPGVAIGKNCLIGLGCYLRKDKRVPDGTRITSVAAVPLRTASRIEKGNPYWLG